MPRRSNFKRAADAVRRWLRSPESTSVDDAGATPPVGSGSEPRERTAADATAERGSRDRSVATGVGDYEAVQRTLLDAVVELECPIPDLPDPRFATGAQVKQLAADGGNTVKFTVDAPRTQVEGMRLPKKGKVAFSSTLLFCQQLNPETYCPRLQSLLEAIHWSIRAIIGYNTSRRIAFGVELPGTARLGETKFTINFSQAQFLVRVRYPIETQFYITEGIKDNAIVRSITWGSVVSKIPDMAVAFVPTGEGYDGRTRSIALTDVRG